MINKSHEQYTEPFINVHGKTGAAQVESTLARLGFCRTAPMGGRMHRYPSCDFKCNVYNSCTDRQELDSMPHDHGNDS